MEEWKAYSKNTRFDVSTTGQVRLVDKIINPHHFGKYYRISTHTIDILLHKLVAETFIPQPDHCDSVRHINGDAHDNRVSNLQWYKKTNGPKKSTETNIIQRIKSTSKWAMFDTSDRENPELIGIYSSEEEATLLT